MFSDIPNMVARLGDPVYLDRYIDQLLRHYHGD